MSMWRSIDEEDAMRRRAAVPVRYEHIDFVPPPAVAAAAREGLKYRRRATPSNRGGLTVSEAAEEGIGSGVQRAVNLQNRDTVSPEVIKKMRGFFSRHRKNKAIAPEHKNTPWNDKGYVAWLLWGGDPAVGWVEGIIEQMEAADEKEKSASRVAYRFASENEPTDPALWERVQKLTKGEVKSISVDGKTINGPNEGTGFTVFPSAYANGWASKVYKDLGGQWRVKEARGKAKKDVGHGGLDEWFSGHGGAKGKGEDATWGDWVSISPVEKTLDSGKEVKPGDIVGPCGISDDPDWKEITKGGEDPLKCMPRQKAYKMPQQERADKAKAKQKAEEADSSRGQKPTMTPTFKAAAERDLRLRRIQMKREASAHLRSSWDVYRPLSEIDPGTQEILDAPTPDWLDRDYPYVVPPGHQGTLKELDYLISLVPLRDHYAAFLRETDESLSTTFLLLAEELGVPVEKEMLAEIQTEAASLITKLKWLYNRPRPYQVAEAEGIAFTPMESKTAHTPAYPSGHAIQGYLLASHLSGIAPQHRAAFMDLAHRCAWGRVVAGYHWPSDIIFGRDIYRHIVHWQMPAAIRVAARYEKAATLSDGERSDREDERLVRQSPKKRPPRKDLERGRVQDDVDVDADEKQDQKDRSRNYKDAALQVACRYAAAAAEKVTVRRKEDDKVVVVNRDTLKEQGGAYEEIEGGADSSSDSSSDSESSSPADSSGESESSSASPPRSMAERGEEAKEKLKSLAPQQAFAVEDLGAAELEAVVSQLESAADQMVESVTGAGDRERARIRAQSAQKVLEKIDSDNPPSPQEIAEAIVAMKAAEVLDDPGMLNPTRPLDSLSTEPLSLGGAKNESAYRDQMAEQSLDAMRSYRGFSQSDRDDHREKLETSLKEMDANGQADSERYAATLSQMRGLMIATALEGEAGEGGVNSSFQLMLKGADKAGKLDSFVKLNITGAAGGDGNAQAAFREVISDLSDDELLEMVPDDHPARFALETLQDETTAAHMSAEARDKLRTYVQDAIMGDVLFTDQSLISGADPIKLEKRTVEPAKHQNPFLAFLTTFMEEQGVKFAAHDATSHYDFSPWGDISLRGSG